MKKTKIWISIFLLILGACKAPNAKNIPSEANQNVVHINQLPDIPTEMDFFGEKIDLTDQDVRERLDREILVNAYFQSSTSLCIKRAARFFPEIESILTKEKVPLDFKYLCVIESGLSNAESPAGAVGFWQFMPFTAEEHNLKINAEVDERRDLKKSTQAACELIKSNYSLFNDWVAACAAYNRGPGGLRDDMAFQHVNHVFDTELNPETARYVFRILAMKLILSDPKAYGYHIPKDQCYEAISTKNILVKKDIPNLADWAVKHKTNRKLIRLLNPWILGNKLTGTSIPCTLKVPIQNGKLGPYVNQ